MEWGESSHLLCPACVWTKLSGAPARVVLDVHQAGTLLSVKMLGVSAGGQCPKVPVDTWLSVRFYQKCTAFSPVFKNCIWLVFLCFYSYLILLSIVASIYIF